MGGGNRNLDSRLDSHESSYKSPKSSYESSLQNKRIKIFWIIFSVLLIALILVHCFRIRPYNERSSDVIYVAVDSIKDATDSILGAMKEYAEIDANFSEYIKNIAYTRAPSDKPNIVLIIGESAQRNLMQIYGHYLPNTPYLSAIQTQKPQNLFVFDNVISSQVTTFESLSQVLTFANQDNLDKKWFEYLNVIDALKLGGYKAVVISNQERFSLWSKATTTIFSRADELHWSADSVAGKSLDTMGFDGAVLPILDRVVSNSFSGNHSADLANFECSQTSSLVSHSKFTKSNESHTENPSVVDSANAESNATNSSLRDEPTGSAWQSKPNRHSERSTKCEAKNPKNHFVDSSPFSKAQNDKYGLFLTIHLMGSHIGYANRYPKDFERFTPSDIADNPRINNLSSAQKFRAKADLAQYANSVLYTDFVLSEIIKRFADKDSIVIYISDHANDVWDSGVGSLRTDSKITRFMVEIPFIVFVSDKFKALHPEIYTQIAKSTHKPFMIDDLIHALIFIAGFRIDGFESARSLFSDDFNANRVRNLGTKANQNYDKTLK